MIILGIDQSLVASGWAVLRFKGERFKFKDYGLIQPRKLRGDERLIYIENEVKELIGRFRPDHAVLEGYAYVGKAKTTSLMQLGELGWAIRRLFVMTAIKYSIINPKTLKKQITGNGNAKKEDMIRRAKKISGAKFGRVPKGKVDNVVDAFCLAYLAGIEG